MTAALRRGDDPYTVETSGGRVIFKTKTLHAAHLKAQMLCAEGHDYSVWQGGRKVLTYFGWRGESLKDDRNK